jgi:hypothetical protein
LRACQVWPAGTVLVAEPGCEQVSQVKSGELLSRRGRS